MNLKSIFQEPQYTIDSVGLSIEQPHVLAINLVKVSGNPFAKKYLTRYIEDVTVRYTDDNKDLYHNLELNQKVIIDKLDDKFIVILNVKNINYHYLLTLQISNDDVYLLSSLLIPGRVVGDLFDSNNSVYIPVYENVIHNESVKYKFYLHKYSLVVSENRPDLVSKITKSPLLITPNEIIFNNLVYGDTLGTVFLIFVGNLSTIILTEKHNPSFELLKSILSKVILFDVNILKSTDDTLKFSARIRGRFIRNTNIDGYMHHYNDLMMSRSETDPLLEFTLTTNTITITLDDDPTSILFHNQFDLTKDKLVDLSLRYEKIFYQGLTSSEFNVDYEFLGEFIFIDNVYDNNLSIDIKIVLDYIKSKLPNVRDYLHLKFKVIYLNLNDKKAITELLDSVNEWYKQPTIITSDVNILGKFRLSGYKNTYLISNHEKLN